MGVVGQDLMEHESFLDDAIAEPEHSTEWTVFLPSGENTVTAAGVVTAGVIGASIAGGPGLVVGAAAGAMCYAADGVRGGSGTVTACIAGGIAAGPVGVPLGLASAVAYNHQDSIKYALGIAEDEEECEATPPEPLMMIEDPIANSQPGIFSRRCPLCAEGMRKVLENFGCLKPVQPRLAFEEASVSVNRQTMKRHEQQSDWAKTILLYETSSDPPAPPGEQRPQPRRAHQLALNGRGEELIDNDNFTGCMVLMYRPPQPDMPCPHAKYFSTRTRRWELRIRGRFKRRPTGSLHVGIVLHDYDYRQETSRLARWLQSLGLSPLEHVIGADLHFTFGDRAKEATEPDAEMAQIVGELAVFDQIIETDAGEDPPDLCGSLDGFGRTRAKSGSQNWARITSDLAKNIDLEKTYTFCFWSAARFVDLVDNWSLVDLVPLMPSLGLSSTVLGNWPFHFVVYELDRPTDKGRESSEVRHVEHDKNYIVDIMMVNPNLPENLGLLKRYNFEDAILKPQTPARTSPEKSRPWSSSSPASGSRPLNFPRWVSPRGAPHTQRQGQIEDDANDSSHISPQFSSAEFSR